MPISFLLKIFDKNKDRISIIWTDKEYSYQWLLVQIKSWRKYLIENKITPGSVTAIQGDFSPVTIAILFALIANKNIIVPLVNSSNEDVNSKLDIAGINFYFLINELDEVSFTKINYSREYDIYNNLIREDKPGLVLFTSGSSGKPKAAVHDFSKLLEKFKRTRKSYRTINFLLFDHWGGLNTLFHTLSNAGVVLSLQDRSPEKVCSFIERHKIELLPASPTFLNLMLISESYKKYDLSSLKIISYGTEPMPESTLKRIKYIFPQVKLHQTYGLIELGVLRSKSKSDDSLWVKLGGEGYHTRVVDGILHIKADSAMLGYINAPSPFTEDGYFVTGDLVEVEGDYYKILGRQSEQINVGGEKVFPAEVENVLLQFEGINDVTVYGEKNLIMGNIVCAKLRLTKSVDQREFLKNLKKFCRSKLESYKIPVKFEIMEEIQHNERFKKKRTKL